jgi:putative endonuclease
VAADARRRTGAAGEDAVAAWYGERGYEIVDRNWRVREGEIDLVARRGPTVVFCEVKTRRGDRFGQPFEAVTAKKQARLRLLARLWLAEHPGRTADLRFDVASVRPAGPESWTIDVLEAAF